MEVPSPPVYQTCVDLILDPDADRQHEKQSPAPTNEPMILGDWQATWDNGEQEVCMRLDSMPGSVKCLVISRTDERHVELCTNDGCETIKYEADFRPNRITIPTLQFWGARGYLYNDLCEFFEEG